MQTSLTFKNIDPSEHLKSYAREKLDRFDKFLDNPAEANVVLTVEKFRHIAEINITGDRLNINGKEETNDMYSAIDMAMDKIEIQIKKTKQKTRARKGRFKNSGKNIHPENVSFAEDEAGQHVRIKTSNTNRWISKKPSCKWDSLTTISWFSEIPKPIK